MNIVITLPRVLIEAIISGSKSVEIRHSIPQKFNINYDVILVVEKGSHNIPILFSIKQFKVYGDTSIAYRHYTKDAAVPQEWLADYCLKAKIVCVWEIGRVCLLKYPNNAASSIGLKNNPQAFVYNDYDIAQFSFSRSFWSRRVNNEDKLKVYAPDKRRKILLDYFDSDCDVDFLSWCEKNDIPFNWRGMQLK